MTGTVAAPIPVIAALRRFVGVPFAAPTWKHAAYLLLAFPIGLVYFVALVAGVSLGVGLAILWVGLPILLLTLLAWRAAAGFERVLARGLLEVPVPSPAHMGPGLTAWQRVRLLLRDPVTWKSFAFVALKLPTGIVAFALTTCLGFVTLVLAFAPAIVAFTPVTFFGWIMETPGEAVPVVPIGVLGFLVLLHLVNGMAWIFGLFARVMLGPSTIALRDRVDDLRTARARIIEATDAERRRLERDLHDGAQQRLVALSLTLGLAESRLRTDPEAALPLVAQAREEAKHAIEELRELARGLHPPLLSERGLGPALEALATRAPVPVTVSGVPESRLPPPLEAAVYFVTAEALTNVAKYARATAAHVQLAVHGDAVRLDVTDDGVGGADPAGGSGLRGLRDRVEALDGQLMVLSPAGAGTTIVAEIPLEAR